MITGPSAQGGERTSRWSTVPFYSEPGLCYRIVPIRSAGCRIFRPSHFEDRTPPPLLRLLQGIPMDEPFAENNARHHSNCGNVPYRSAGSRRVPAGESTVAGAGDPTPEMS